MKRAMKSKVALLALVVVGLVCVQAPADITIPWQAEGVYGTYQQWTFSYGEELPEGFDFATIAPDEGYENLNGAPDASVYALTDGPTDPYGPDYYPEDVMYETERLGLVYAGPIMQLGLWIPNAPLDLTKIVQVELEYHTQTGELSGYEESWLVPSAYPEVKVEPVDYIEALGEDGWTDLTVEFRFPQNWATEGEWIWIDIHDSGVWLDSIEVATICVPVPAAVLIGTLGLAFAGLKLRKYV